MSNAAFSSNQNSPSPAGLPQRKSNSLLWVMGGCGGIVVLFCGVMTAGLVYIGVVAPETSVYVGSQVPSRYVDVAEEVGAVDQGERIQFFYSDAILDVREGFYLVTDSKVAIYVKDNAPESLEIVPLDRIASAELSRDESFAFDSQITLELDDGSFVAFPVSSEYDRDEAFFKFINQRIE